MTDPIGFQFTEDMRGFAARGQTNYEDGFRDGKASGTPLMFHLTIKTDDLDRFIAVPEHQAQTLGYVESPLVGGRCPVEVGTFNLFVDTADAQHKRMKYRLFFRDGSGAKRTLAGHKEVQNAPGNLDIWAATTTLYTNIFEGHIEEAEEAAATPFATGILHISIADFAKELTTVRAFAPTPGERVAAVARFGKLFAGSLWDTYAHLPSFHYEPYQREIPLYTTEGVHGAEITTHPFTTADKLGLTLQRFKRAPSNDVVLLVHGLTTSTDMFIMPEHYNIVRYLHDHGWSDVWSVDFRMSGRFSYNLQRHRYTLDDCALYDYPAALAALRQVIGPDRRIHVICHCMGSSTFMMSLFGKQVSGVSSVISNSVSLTPRVPGWSNIKLMLAPPLCEYVAGIEYANPLWRREPGFSLGKVLATVVSAFHHECDIPECHMLSFMWGTGFPSVYNHVNMHDITHRRAGDLFSGTSFHYFRHIRKMVKSDNTAVKYDPDNPRYAPLPDNYLQWAADIKTPVLFITGQDNHIFKDSNLLAYDRCNAAAPGLHEKHVFANYGHQDTFMGKNCHVDIFPRLLQFLDKHKGRPAQA
jgi:cholesterol oxidase